MKISGECVHESAAESFPTVTWILDYIQLVIQKVYKAFDIIEVYEYEVIMYDTQKRQVCLLADYINTLLKYKAEASGYPSWVRTSEDEECSFEIFYAREGVRLDRDEIRPNATKLGLAKLFQFALGKIV